jgi:hypothetical protein
MAKKIKGKNVKLHFRSNLIASVSVPSFSLHFHLIAEIGSVRGGAFFVLLSILNLNGHDKERIEILNVCPASNRREGG